MKKVCVECGTEFESRAHNQKYCTNDCCRKANSRKIMENYYAKKERKAGEKRYCAECAAPLSRYNDTEVCEKCSKKDMDDEYAKAIGGIIQNANRGKRKSKAK
jgi:hypothetical protein